VGNGGGASKKRKTPSYLNKLVEEAHHLPRVDPLQLGVDLPDESPEALPSIGLAELVDEGIVECTTPLADVTVEAIESPLGEHFPEFAADVGPLSA
jgi:hypothetical protein